MEDHTIIDCGDGIIHRQNAFTAEVAEHPDGGYGIACTACEGWWPTISGIPIVYVGPAKAHKALRRHDQFEHRERVR